MKQNYRNEELIKNITYLTTDKNYEIMDVREFAHNYYSQVIIRAGELLGRKNLVVIQSYEPLSLIQFLSDKGWQYRTRKLNEEEYCIYFFHTNVNKN
jgi:hypothetical protein